VPNTSISNDNKLKLENGVYYFNNKPYSGFIKENYNNDTVKVSSIIKKTTRNDPKLFLKMESWKPNEIIKRYYMDRRVMVIGKMAI
jgi:hypothetical protein